MNEFVKGGLWEPEKVRWDHPKIEKYIEENWEEKGDKELAEDLSEITGKNITPHKAKKKRLDMELHRSSGGNIEKIENPGQETKIDWESAEVKKYIQARYKDQSDLEMSRGLSEKYDKNITWKMVKRHRLRMGYKRESRSKPKADDLDLDQPKYRRYIYDKHPKLDGSEHEYINEFLVDFYDEFDIDLNIKSLKRRMNLFLKNDPAIQNLRKIRRSEIANDKLSRWFDD